MCLDFLAYLAHCLLLDKLLLCSPYIDVWQLRRGSRWGPGEHVSCASHHPSTVFPFTPAANGPKLQETSHCCFSQSVTQAARKLKMLFSFFFFPPPCLCSFPLSLCSSSVFSSLCFGVKSMGFCLLGLYRLRIKAGWRWARSSVDSRSGGVLGESYHPTFHWWEWEGEGRLCLFYLSKACLSILFPTLSWGKRQQDLVTSSSSPM